MPTNYNPDTDALETMQERFAREAEVDERIMCGEREKAVKTEHTPEPWKVSDDENGECVVFADKNNVQGAKGSEFIDCNTSANARRIVACVNACAGLSTEFLEQIDSIQAALTGQLVVTEVLENQRDELLAALERSLESFEYIAKYGNSCGHSQLRIPDLKAAIASVKGSAA